MPTFSKKLKILTLAGLTGIGLAGAWATSALADYAYTQCDRNGDRCWQIRCDDDGDDCHSINNTYSNPDYDRPDYYGDENSDRVVCDDDGDRCYRTNDSYRPGFSLGFGWDY